MIDLHNHILPGLDDGAVDFDESLEIARTFVNEGVTAVAATPHLNPLQQRGAAGPDVLKAVNELRKRLDEAGVQLSVTVGNELFLTPEAPELAESGEAASLAAGHYLLVEVSLNAAEPPLYFEDALFRLQVAGFTPVLAHPERYPFVRDDPESLDELIHREIVMQVTAPSLLGHYGREVRSTATLLLRRGAYAVAASDRHHPGPERSLRSLHARIVDLVSQDQADLLLKHNPSRILHDEIVERPELLPAERRTFWSRLL